MAFQTPQSANRDQQQPAFSLLFTPSSGKSGLEGGKGTPVLGHLGRSPSSNTPGFGLGRSFSRNEPPSSSRRRSLTPSSLAKDTPPPPPGDSLLDSPGAAGPSLAAWGGLGGQGTPTDAGGPEDMMISPSGGSQQPMSLGTGVNQQQAETTTAAMASRQAGSRVFQEYHDTWVTVFGFASSDISLVLREFGKCGDIVHFGTFGDGPSVNWLHIKFSNKHAAQRALLRNGDQLSATCMVGVKPTDPTKKTSLEQELSSGRSTTLTLAVPKPAQSRLYQLDASSAAEAAVIPLASKSAWEKVSEFVLGL